MKASVVNAQGIPNRLTSVSGSVSDNPVYTTGCMILDILQYLVIPAYITSGGVMTDFFERG